MIQIIIEISWDDVEKGKVKIMAVENTPTEVVNDVELKLALAIRDITQLLIKYPNEVIKALTPISKGMRVEDQEDNDKEDQE